MSVPMCECGHPLVHPTHVRARDTWGVQGGCRYCADCTREPEQDQATTPAR